MSQRNWPLALAGSLFAAALLVSAPSGLGRSWRAAEAGSRYLMSPWPLFAALLFIAAAIKGEQGQGSARLRAFALPVLATTPALLLKVDCYNPTWWLLPKGLAAILLAGIAGRELGRPRTAAVLALVGLLAVGWAARAEKLRREQEVANGRVELLLRELADAIGRDTAATARRRPSPRPAPGPLRVPGWQITTHGDWYWGAGARFGARSAAAALQRARASASAWAVVLRTVPSPDRSRQPAVRAELTADGGLTWVWPQGPPPAVAARQVGAGG